ncbi:hypothetical protein [Clostridium sp. chh4-2]|uniref:hypothetical protein n=1 Tax=Clostridium sp. chh4-2 TaxID=2067550 RepID=UPI001FA8A63E|nr:hypothetical protein [Clostridium sp. chh4-2]
MTKCRAYNSLLFERSMCCYNAKEEEDTAEQQDENRKWSGSNGANKAEPKKAAYETGTGGKQRQQENCKKT